MAKDVMEKRRFGKTDMHVSVLGFGGYEIGCSSASPEDIARLLNTALDAGLNVLDTAACYKDSEMLIGNAVGHRRKDFFLFTKAGHASGLNFSDWDPSLVEASIDRSLVRLKTDCVDLVQLHTCDRATLEKGDAFRAVERARNAGKTRYIGYSGDGEAALYAVQSGLFDALQTSISIADQEALALTLPIAAEKHMGVIAKRPIANAVWRNSGVPKEAYHRPYFHRINELKYDFLNKALEESVGVALRFTLAAPGVHTAIVGTENPERYAKNAALLKAGPLPAHECSAIRDRWNAVARPDWGGLS